MLRLLARVSSSSLGSRGKCNITLLFFVIAVSRSCQIHAEFCAKNKRSIFPFRERKRSLSNPSFGRVKDTLHHRLLPDVNSQ